MSKLRAFVARLSNSKKSTDILGKYNNCLSGIKGYSMGSFSQIEKSKILKISTNVEKYMFDSSKTDHIELNSEPVEFAGRDLYISNLFVRNEPTNAKSAPTLRIANSEEITSSNSFVLGGISGDEVKQISSLLKTAKILASKSSSHNPYTPLAIYPEVSRADRYDAVKEYNNNPEFVPDYIKSRVETLILPRVIDNLDLNCKDNVISILSFSMGGREIMMMQTALRNILENDLSISKKVADIAMSDIRTVSIGYAPNLNAFESAGFNKVVVFSLDDRGVLLPKDLCDQVLVRKSVLEKGFFIEKRSKLLEALQYLVIDSDESFPAKNEILQDHTIKNYLDFIEALPYETQQVIGDSLTCYD